MHRLYICHLPLNTVTCACGSSQFVIAALHCELGSQWCRITPYLIARTQNACKNHWNATWRSKMPDKAHSLLVGATVESEHGGPLPGVIIFSTTS